MSEQENKQLARSIYDEMWNRGDPAAAAGLFARPQGVEKFVREFRAAFPNLRHTVEEVLAEGDRVMVRFSAAGTHSGPWKQYPATGRPIRYTGVTLLTIEEGRITDHHTWWDTFELIEQIRA